jgi:hypothetical protein
LQSRLLQLLPLLQQPMLVLWLLSLLPPLARFHAHVDTIAIWLRNEAQARTLEALAEALVRLLPSSLSAEAAFESLYLQALTLAVGLFGVGSYFSSHLLRSVLAVFGRHLPLSIGFRPGFFSERSIGSMLHRPSRLYFIFEYLVSGL